MADRKYAIELQSRCVGLSGPNHFVYGQTLYNIIALKDFVCQDGTVVHAGDPGGLVESEANLSQEGSCWITLDAAVCGEAFVCGDALVSDAARVADGSVVKDKAVVKGYSIVRNQAIIEDHAVVRGHTKVTGNTRVSGREVVDD